MRPSRLTIERPATLDEAIIAFDAAPAAVLLAGGQHLIKQLRDRTLNPARIIDLGALAELAGIETAPDTLYAGALTTLATLVRDARAAAHCPALAHAAARVGDVQIRNRATVGGNLMSGWSGDLGVVLAALRAPVRLRSAAATRTFGADRLLADGLAAGEIITGVEVPASAASAFEKLSRRSADPALASAAACVWRSASGVQVGLAVGGAHRHASRVPEVEALYNGGERRRKVLADAMVAAAAAFTPPDTPHASAAYRRRVMPTVLLRALERALAAAGAEVPR